jgi:uncharacterized membrane protein (UPF0127 family)
MRRSGLRLYNETHGSVAAEQVFVADRYFSRLRGLIGYPPLARSAVLWIKPCRQVHTHFLNSPLHVVFVDREMRVVHVCDALRPWRISPWVKGASSVLEFSDRPVVEVAKGDRLRVR